MRFPSGDRLPAICGGTDLRSAAAEKLSPEPPAEVLDRGAGSSADDHDGSAGAVDDFGGDVSEHVGMHGAAARSGSGDDEVVVAFADFFQYPRWDCSGADFHGDAGADGFER